MSIKGFLHFHFVLVKHSIVFFVCILTTHICASSTSQSSTIIVKYPSFQDPEARAIVDQRMYFDMGAFYKVLFNF